MPNYVTNQLKAAPAVIQHLLNADGDIDFNTVMTFPGHYPWNYVSSSAETLAEKVVGTPLSDHPQLRAMEQMSREQACLAELDDRSFEQFVQMLRNYRQHQVLHPNDFARQYWGTKWNANTRRVNLAEGEAEGEAEFDTAWNCPEGLLVALSKLFPSEPLDVVFADEDIGSNCGRFRLLNGEFVEADLAPAYRDQSEAERAKWRAFALAVKGRSEEDEDADA